MTESRIISKSATFTAHGNNYWVDIFLVKEKAANLVSDWKEKFLTVISSHTHFNVLQ